MRHNDYLVDEFQMRIPEEKRTLETCRAFFCGVRTGVLAFATWKDGEQFTAMGRNAREAIAEVNQSEALAIKTLLEG